jgi:hypothetical protein
MYRLFEKAKMGRRIDAEVEIWKLRKKAVKGESGSNIQVCPVTIAVQRT